MRYIMLLAFLVVISLLVDLSFAADISNCTVINEPGFYTISTELSGAPNTVPSDVFPGLSACIYVNSSDVNLYCGFNSINNGGPNSTGIFIQKVSNVTVQYCTLNNYTVGILLEVANNNSFISDTAQNNELAGFIVVASSNNYFDGDSAYSNNPNDNTFLGLKAGGFVFSDSSNNTLSSCYGSGNKQYGLGFLKQKEGSHNNQVIAGAFFNNLMYGVYLDSGDNNSFGQYVNFGNNQVADFFITTDSAIVVNITNSSFGTNLLQLNDHLSPGDSYSISRSDAPPELPPSYSAFNNKFVNITPLSSGLIIDNIAWQWQDYEVNPPDENLFELWKYNGITWTNTGATLDNVSNTLTLSNVDPSSVYAILYPTVATPVSSCMALYLPGEYYLNQSITGATDWVGYPISFACIRIASSDVTFDCKGFSITNDNTPDSAGIFVPYANNAKLQNCRVSNYSYGLYSYTSSNVRFINNTVANNDVGTSIQNSQQEILLENGHFFNNKEDLNVHLDPYYEPSFFTMTNTIFDNPSGNFKNFTKLSISDLMLPEDTLSVQWMGRPFENYIELPPGIVIPPLPSPYLSFKEKFVTISSSPENFSMDNITWHWTDSESSGLNEDSFELWKISEELIWKNTSADRNTEANTLSLENENLGGIYAFLYTGTGPQPNQTGGCAKVTMAFTPNCTENVITFFANDVPFVGANVTIVRNNTNISKGLTDAEGKFRFKAIGGEIKILIKKENLTVGECYQIVGGGLSSTLVSEAQCAKENPPCKKNSDCKAGLVCLNNTCVTPYVTPPPPPPPEAPKCIRDADCSPSDYCRLGSCVKVKGTCGYVYNHTWTSYECCSDAYCSDGKTCVSNKCVLARYRLIGETTGSVGERISIAVLSDSKPFPNAQLKVTNPDGDFTIITTDASGRSAVLLLKEGVYTVELLVNGKLFGKLAITSVPSKLPPEVPKPSDILAQPGVVIILLIILAALAFSVYEFLFKHKKKARKR